MFTRYHIWLEFAYQYMADKYCSANSHTCTFHI